MRNFKNKSELIFYVSICVGIAINSSSFTIVSAIFDVATLPIIITSVFLAGIFCIIISDSVSELANKFPSSPGVRTYFKKAFSKNYSLFLVYLYVIFIIIAGAVESSLFAYIYNELLPDVNPIAILTLMLSATIIMNLNGFALPRVLQIFSTIVLIGILLFLGFYGMSSGAVSNTNPTLEKTTFLDTAISLPMALGFAIFLFVGFEWVTPLGFSRESYKKKIPISMPLGIIINIVIYCIFIIGLANLISQKEIANEILPQLKLAQGVLPNYGKYLIVFLATTCTISTFNAGLLGGSKLIYALAREKKFPSYLIKVSMKTGQPYIAIIFIGLFVEIIAILTHLFELELLLATCATSIMTLIYASLLIASNRLRGKTSSLTVETYKPVFSQNLKKLSALILISIGISIIFSLPGSELTIIKVLVILILIAFFLMKKYNRVNNKIDT